MYYLNHIQQRGFKWEESFRLAVLCTVAVFIYHCFQLPEGDWIFYTVTFIYMGGVLNGPAMQRAIKRFYGATGGMIAGFLIMGLLTYYDYRYIYLLPLFGVIAFWYLFVTGEYGGFILCFMVFFMLFYDLTFAVNEELNLFNLIWARVIATILGGLLIIGGELLIFPRTSTATGDIPEIGPEIFRRLGSVLETAVRHGSHPHPGSHEYWEPFSLLNVRIEQFNDLRKSYALEPAPRPETTAELTALYRAMSDIYEGALLVELKAAHPYTPPDAAAIVYLEQAAQWLQQTDAAIPPPPPVRQKEVLDPEAALATGLISRGIQLAAATFPALRQP